MKGLNIGGDGRPIGFHGTWDTLQYSGNDYDVSSSRLTIDHDLISSTPIPRPDFYRRRA